MRRLPTLVALVALLFLAGCTAQEPYLSFPVSQALLNTLDEVEVGQVSEFHVIIVGALIGFTLASDLVIGLFTFPHDLGVFLSRSTRGSSSRLSYEDAPPDVRKLIDIDSRKTAFGRDAP